jgi:hypothetical protein
VAQLWLANDVIDVTPLASPITGVGEFRLDVVSSPTLPKAGGCTVSACGGLRKTGEIPLLPLKQELLEATPEASSYAAA